MPATTALATLLDVAGECGLDRMRFEADLADEQIERAVLKDHNEAFELGITAVPTVLVDGDVAVPGAQDLRFYRHVIERRLALARGTHG